MRTVELGSWDGCDAWEVPRELSIGRDKDEIHRSSSVGAHGGRSVIDARVERSVIDHW